jgi:hypothetical protein
MRVSGMVGLQITPVGRQVADHGGLVTKPCCRQDFPSVPVQGVARWARYTGREIARRRLAVTLIGDGCELVADADALPGQDIALGVVFSSRLTAGLGHSGLSCRRLLPFEYIPYSAQTVLAV